MNVCVHCRRSNDAAAEVCFHCGTPMSAITKGAVLASRYEVVELLGRGGMGVVYKANDRALNEIVAIKVLRSDIARSPDVGERFRAEIRLARKVGHRNVCRIYEYGEDAGVSYIAMELVEGVDLRRVLQKGPLPPDQALEVAIQIGKGLHAIHELGIIHRDLKTSNIMIDGRGVVRLMDFGIAKRMDATKGVTATGHIVGTPEYMSPEQARGLRVDERSDVYALGIVVFEIFTGQVPFRADSPIATILQHLNDPPLEGPEAAALPPLMVPILARALAKEPDARYSSAQEMVDALRQTRPSAHGTPVSIDTSSWEVLEASPASGPPPLATPAAGGPRRTPMQGPSARTPAARRPGPPAGADLSLDLLREEPRPRRWPLAIGALLLVAGVAAVALKRQGAVRNVETAASPSPVVATSRAPSPSLAPPTGRPPSTVVSPSPVPVGRVGVPASPAVPRPRAATPASPKPLAVARAPVPTPTPATPAPAAAPAADEGVLQLLVTPESEVLVDNLSLGRLTARDVTLKEGSHVISFVHPEYERYNKRVTIKAGERQPYTVDMARKARRKENR